ncbi:MAG TPA: hypothetical protein VG476_02235 [Acidimicrobiales bacterium]|nr:hypothetical protein [Acidimicrobiales bacterium]
MRAHDVDQLATKLGRPAATLSALRDLTPEQVGLLSDAIDDAVAARRRALDDAFSTALPSLPRRVLLGVLRFGAGERR